MEITQKIILDLHHPVSYQLVWAKQGDDESRKLIIQFTDSGVPYTVPADANVVLRVRRPDGIFLTSPLGTRNPDGTASILMSGAMLATPGIVEADACIIQGEKTLSSFNFEIRVQKFPAGVIDPGDADGTNWLRLIQDATQSVSLGITGAVAGQIAKIAAVDENGVPTAWEAVDMPEGGGGDEPVGSFAVTWNLRNVSSSSDVSSVSAGAALVAVLTPETGYTLGDVTVTMGGVALSGVWDADTSTVTIASVTGDVVISCAGVEQSEPQSETLSTMKWKQSGWPSFTDNGDGSFAMTINDTLFDKPTSTNPYWTLIYPGEIAGGFVSIRFNKAVTSGSIYVIIYAGDQAAQNFVDSTKNGFLWVGGVEGFSITSISADAEVKMPEGTYPFIWVRNNSLLMDGDEKSGNTVTANHIVNGDITFTVSDAAAPQTVEVLSVDDDYAQNYMLSTTALVTDGAESTATGIDAQYAAVIEQAKNEWMLEANGNFNKIPLIVHTDQHGFLNHSVLFDYLAEIINWYDVGKVINLGDTVGMWIDNDTEHPLTDCADLDEYLSAMKKVPFSKRIEVFGNHDTWKLENGAFVGLTPQNYLYKYFRNIYARRIDNYGNFVVRDDGYNVKYLVVSGFAYDPALGGYSHYIIPSDSIDWIIAELEKADGYDVVILSHVCLGSTETMVFNPIDGTDKYADVGGVNHTLLTELWSGRKARTSGNVTDEYGVTHSFDFTACDGELLCGLHGHTHDDRYYYIEGLLDVGFDAYYLNPRAFYFVLIDRENRQLNVWKVDSTPQFQNYQIALDETVI